MTDDNFSESWLKGNPHPDFTPAVIDARKEFFGMDEKAVRDIARRLSGAVRKWKLQHGATEDELDDSITLRRRTTHFGSDIDILIQNYEDPIFMDVAPFSQAIAIQVFMAAEQHDTAAVMRGMSMLQKLQILQSVNSLKENRLRKLLEAVKLYRNHVDEKRKRSRRDRIAYST